MNQSIRGGLAVAMLCALLVACGGGGGDAAQPATLPASVAISNDARAEAGTPTRFATDVAATDGLAFHWDFGDGQTGSGATTSHIYAKSGQYTVTLAVTNSGEDLRLSTSTIVVGAYANVAGLDCTQADSSGWCWQHALGSGHQVNDVFFVDAAHAWAVGESLTILKSSDGGASWTRVAPDASTANASLSAVRFLDAQHGMILTDRGWALQTSDGGATWTPNPLGGMLATPHFIDYTASRIVLQSQYAGNTAMSVDSGGTWSAVGTTGQVQATASDCWTFGSDGVLRAAGCGATATTSLTLPYSGPSPAYLLAGNFASTTQGFALGYTYNYDTTTGWTWTWMWWNTADGGASWASSLPAGLANYSYYYNIALHMEDGQAGTLYTPGDLTAYTTRDGGLDWTAVTPASALSQVYNGYRAAGFVGNVMWQSSGSHVATSVDRGQTWHDADVADEDAPAQYGRQTSAIAVTQYTDASNYVIATSHRFYVTHDAGRTFTRLLGPDSRDAAAVAAAGSFIDAKNGKFISANGAILSTADGGRSWTRADYPTTSGQAVALHFNSAVDGWLILNGQLAHTTDGGANWSTPLASSAMTSLQGMSWADTSHAWAWNNGNLFATTDGGATWTKLTLPASTYPSGAVMTGPNSGVVAAPYDGYRVTSDGGVTWQKVSAQSGYGEMVSAGGKTVWSINSTASRSKDGGLTWEAAGPAGYTYDITGLTFADEQHGWMITSTGVVLHTADGGDTWTAQPVGADVSLSAVVAVDAQTAWIITRDGQILATATAGN